MKVQKICFDIFVLFLTFSVLSQKDLNCKCFFLTRRAFKVSFSKSLFLLMESVLILFFF